MFLLVFNYSDKIELALKNFNIKMFDCTQFRDFKCIGTGSSAIVYTADFQGKRYALKVFHNNLFMENKAVKQFIREVMYLFIARHQFLKT